MALINKNSDEDRGSDADEYLAEQACSEARERQPSPKGRSAKFYTWGLRKYLRHSFECEVALSKIPLKLAVCLITYSFFIIGLSDSERKDQEKI